MFYKKTIKKGFTLIELLVVVAIISLLSSIIFANLSTARAKARDTKVKSEFNQVGLALNLYFDKFGVYPTIASPVSPHTADFINMAQQLVTAGFLSSVPAAPTNHTYAYYNYGPGSVPYAGALLVTTLETIPNSVTGIPPSCRPWPPATNWCGADLSQYYCICNSY